MSADQDMAARKRMVSDMEGNFLVEAGAGSGKTGSLVARFLRLVAREKGRLERVAAITFTRKAADEMKGRVQVALEHSVRDGKWGFRDSLEPVPKADLPYLKVALANLERLRVGTIHAFCTSLLKARPFEAGVDPLFSVLEDGEEFGAAVEGLSQHLREHKTDARLARQLRLTVDKMAGYFLAWTRAKDEGLDLAVHGETPDLKKMGKGLIALLKIAETTADKLVEGKIDELHRGAETIARANPSSDSVQEMGWALNLIGGRLDTITKGAKGGWLQGKSPVSKGSYADAGEFQELLEKLAGLEETHGISGLLAQWRAWRHAQINNLFEHAAEDTRELRLRSGRLTYQDLLSVSLRLAQRPEALEAMRGDLGAVLVDEAQDIDPLQLQLVLALAGQGKVEKEWEKTRLRPGALFLVGDPKQSIYAFRRADIQLYLQVRNWASQEKEGGLKLLSLSRNFRSYKPIIEPVNNWGTTLLVESPWQAGYSNMESQADPGKKQLAPEGIWSVACEKGEHEKRTAYLVALLLAQPGEDGKDLEPGEILILTPNKRSLPGLSRALEAHGIPHEVSGAENLGDFEEEAELARLMMWLADAEDESALAGVLRGSLFGYTEEDLAREALEEKGLKPPEKLKELKESLEGLSATQVVETLLFKAKFLKLAQAAPEAREMRLGNLWAWLESWRGRESAGEVLTLRGMADELSELAFAMKTYNEDVETREGRHLRMGARNVVRLMNLHKAKGLEASVVILADPEKTRREPKPGRIVLRTAGGQNRVLLPLADYDAKPLEWDTHLADAQQADDAEYFRLLYVAATRAKQTLFIMDSGTKKGYWNPLAPLCTGGEFDLEKKFEEVHKAAGGPFISYLSECGTPLYQELEIWKQERAKLPERRKAWIKPGFEEIPAKELAKQQSEDNSIPKPQMPQIVHLRADLTISGAAFGDAMHALFDRMARRLPGFLDPAEMQRLAWILAEKHGFEGKEREAARAKLLEAADKLTQSPIWQRAKAADQVWPEYEVILAVNGKLVTAVIDCLVLEKDGAVLLDWKSDKREETGGEYGAQLDIYAQALAKVGVGVKERHLVYVK